MCGVCVELCLMCYLRLQLQPHKSAQTHHSPLEIYIALMLHADTRICEIEIGFHRIRFRPFSHDRSIGAGPQIRCATPFIDKRIRARTALTRTQRAKTNVVRDVAFVALSESERRAINRGHVQYCARAACGLELNAPCRRRQADMQYASGAGGSTATRAHIDRIRWTINNKFN